LFLSANAPHRADPFQKKVTVTGAPVDKVATLKSIVEVRMCVASGSSCQLTALAQDSLHREIDALIGVKHGEAIVAALKEAAVTFLKRAKPLLAASDVAAVAAASSASEPAAVATTADESAGKRKREEEMQENPEDARNRRRLERAQKTLAALAAEQDRWKALDSEQFGAADLAASKRVDAQQSKQRRPTVLEDTRRVVAATALPLDDARRAFESISMNVSGRRACAAGGASQLFC
jgi:hypothetical protein